MFNIENYDVQETRRIAREEGIVLGDVRGIEIGEARGIEIGETRGEVRGLQIAKMFFQKKTPVEISAVLGIPTEKVLGILRESGLVD